MECLLKHAHNKKHTTYPEFSREGSRAKLIVFAVEVGGRWSEEGSKFLIALVRAKSYSEPLHLQQSAFMAWHQRWRSLISTAGQRAFGASLLSLPEVHGAGGNIPSLDEVLAEGRYLTEFDEESIHLEEGLDGSVEPQDGIQIQSTGHGMIAPPGAARGALDTSPCEREYPYPGGSRLNTLTHE